MVPKQQKIRLFSMFSGFGGASFALKKAEIDFECVGFSEIDKYAIQCYGQNHFHKTDGGTFFSPIDNYGDCSKINVKELPDFDLLTGGFPCQSFSVAGKGLGELDTRGTLFNEIIRVAESKKPRYMLLENVKGLTFKNHRETFNKILSELRRIGYNVKYKVLNTKEHGIPQNRERIFFFCFRDREEWKNFKLPKKVQLKTFLKDILEKKVDEKYYLKEEQVKKLLDGFIRAGTIPMNNKAIMCGNLSRYKMKSPRNPNFKEEGVSWCIDTSNGNGILEENEVMKHINNKGRIVKKKDGTSFALTSSGRNCGSNQIVQLDVSNIKREGKPRVYEKVSRTLNTAQGGGHIPLILDCYNKKIKEIVPTLTEPHHNNLRLAEPIIVASRGRYKDGKDGETEQKLEPKFDGTSNTISTIQKDNYVFNGFRIRKLTPTECFRLMGFNDEINLNSLSDTQKYKLAGNGWDINLVSKIFKQMIK